MQRQRKPNQDQPRIYGVYIPSVLTMKVSLSITEVGKNIKQNLERLISSQTENKCIAEGFIKPNSIQVISYSSGSVNGDRIEFQTVFECKICNPVEGMIIECVSKTITKAGIHAEVVDENGIIPLTVFITRDHHFSDKLFASVKEGTKMTVRVIGTRFELNDPYICVIGKIVEQQNIQKPTIKIGGNVSSDDDTDDDIA